MYALLGSDNETVIGIFPPDVSDETVEKERGNLQVIKITLENSPCYLNGKYKDGIFHLPEELI
jgi:hypothetical protein